jgi:transposase
LTGSLAPKRVGGDRRSHHLEQHAGLILEAVEEQVDITIAELQALLKAHGISASYGAVWNLLDRHELTYKKRPLMLVNKTARMSQQRG